MDLNAMVKSAKTYQLGVCAQKMANINNTATDNLTSRIAMIVHNTCMEELKSRQEAKLKINGNLGYCMECDAPATIACEHH